MDLLEEIRLSEGRRQMPYHHFRPSSFRTHLHLPILQFGLLLLRILLLLYFASTKHTNTNWYFPSFSSLLFCSVLSFALFTNWAGSAPPQVQPLRPNTPDSPTVHTLIKGINRLVCFGFEIRNKTKS